MKPLPRTLVIGLAVSACALGALAAARWMPRITPAPASLASRLPAEAVLAYVELPRGGTIDASTFERIAPSLPTPPSPPPTATVAAAVVRSGGVTGWITMGVDDHGKTSFGGSDPSLSSLLTDERPPLAADRAFKNLRMAGSGAWTYVDFPAAGTGGSMLAGMFALDGPMSYSIDAEGTLTLRFAVRAAPASVATAVRPMARLSDPSAVILLPSRAVLPSVATTLSTDASLVAETLATTFADSIAPGTSLRYELLPLLDGPSVLQLGPNGSGETVFFFDGKGPASGVARAMETLHERFGSTRGGSRAKVVSAEGYSITTLTPDADSETTRSTSGGRTILRTRAGGFTLTSAIDASGRFSITNDPAGYDGNGDENATPAPERSSVAWTNGLVRGLHPLWPGLSTRGGAPLGIELSYGNEYVEWTLSPLEKGR